MADTKRTVVVSVLGTQLDSGKGPSRWERWRPSVALCQHDDLLVDELWLLHEPRAQGLAYLVRDDIAHVSPDTRVHVEPFALGDPWDFEEVYGALFDFAASRAFDPAKVDLYVHITTGTHVVQICLFLLTESRHLPGKLLQTSPRDPRGDGSEHSPRGTFGVVDLDLERYEAIATRTRAEHSRGEAILKDGIATRNAAYNTLVAKVEEVAVRSKAPMLFLGPTGAGKSALARRVFALKKARQGLSGPFVEVNCATLRGDLAMSTLFGHKKGAFTGALTDRDGQLLRAHGGVLFLDEIFELGADEQAMLLRAIEDKTFVPMGSDVEKASDFQLLCGTNADLFAAAQAGTFRPDLLARIDLWTFRLPSLRERVEDIAPNLEHESARVGRLLGRNVTWTREARDAYLAFATSPRAAWPGNFRDLAASVTRLATLATEGRITRERVLEEISTLESRSSGVPKDPSESLVGRVLPGVTLDRFDAVQLADVLRVCKESRTLSEAGRELFAASRSKKAKSNDADRLRKYLARFGLEFVAVREALASGG